MTLALLNIEAAGPAPLSRLDGLTGMDRHAPSPWFRTSSSAGYGKSGENAAETGALARHRPPSQATTPIDVLQEGFRAPGMARTSISRSKALSSEYAMRQTIAGGHACRPEWQLLRTAPAIRIPAGRQRRPLRPAAGTAPKPVQVRRWSAGASAGRPESPGHLHARFRHIATGIFRHHWNSPGKTARAGTLDPA